MKEQELLPHDVYSRSIIIYGPQIKHGHRQFQIADPMLIPCFRIPRPGSCPIKSYKMIAVHAKAGVTIIMFVFPAHYAI